MQDSLYDGRRFRALTLVDTMRRERPAIAVAPSLPGRRVVAVLERLTPTPGLPQVLPVDNGPAVISQALDEWAHRRVPAR